MSKFNVSVLVTGKLPSMLGKSMLQQLLLAPKCSFKQFYNLTVYEY